MLDWQAGTAARGNSEARRGNAFDLARRLYPRSVSHLREFVRIPSVSGDPARLGDATRAARFLAAHLRSLGLRDACLLPTAPGIAPVVFASWQGKTHTPTALFYGHYDVQPVAPLSSWKFPPFAGVVQNDTLYGRGASDDKGSLWTQVCALEACLAAEGGLPINVVCLYEGAEEIDSPGMEAVLERVRPLLRGVECALICDTRMAGRGRPALIIGNRGLAKFDLTVRGPNGPLHSGQFGGAVQNPAHTLIRLLGALVGRDDGRVAVSGFYSGIAFPDQAERERLRQVAPTDDRLFGDAGPGSAAVSGEAGYTLAERTTLLPALTVGGLEARGNPSIIPSEAKAAFGIRLAPGQRPEQVALAVRHHLSRHLPSGARAYLSLRPGASTAASVPRSHRAIRAAVRACVRGFGVAPALLRSGGTIPIVSLLQRRYGIPSVMLGLTLPDDRIHSANERFRLENLRMGTATILHFMHEMAALPKENGR